MAALTLDMAGYLRIFPYGNDISLDLHIAFSLYILPAYTGLIFFV